MDTLNKFSFVGAGIGLVLTSRIAFHRRLPPLIHPYRFLIFGGVGYYLGHMVYLGYEEYTRKQKLFIENYIQEHKEDFPDPPKIKYGDVLLPWKPNR